MAVEGGVLSTENGDRVRKVLRRLPKLGARRGIRATVAGAGTFSLVYQVMHNPTAAIFAAFGSVILLVYVEFAGPKRQRFEQHVGLIVITFFFVFLGTLCSQVLWLAVASTVIVCFCVLMLGVMSASLAGATSAMLISFLLPVAFQGSVSTIPDRLLGWAIGGGASLLAVIFILPSPSSDPLVGVASKAIDKIADYLGTAAKLSVDAGESSVSSEAAAASTALRTTFFATPFRPAGLSVSSRLLIKVIEWTLELDMLLAGYGSWADKRDSADVATLTQACAGLLKETAVALASAGDVTPLEASLNALREARSQLEESALRSLHRHHSATDAATTDSHDAELVAVLDQSFRTDDIADTVEKLADDMVELVTSRHRTWWQQSLGLEAKGSDSRLDAARRRLRSHFSRRSVWLHNSARGAIGLGISVWVAYGFGVQHAFWVVFGTLAVLRSNALSTGQTAVKALTGTIEGIIIGSVIIGLLGTHETVFWILLPFAICFTGFAPSAISFAAGQAGFTMTILILFNIVEPIGWKIGVIRNEDVALGCAVSLIVGLLFWPRGASATLRYSIADAITESVHYLRAAVVFALSCCDKETQTAEDTLEVRRVAQAAARRLDDAFREYLSERGSKSVSLADVASLIAGVTAVRTTADSIQSLWASHDLHSSGDRRVVREALTQGVESVSSWYVQLADVVTGTHETLSAPADFEVSVQELINTVRRDLSDEAGHGTAAAFRIVWTDDYLRQLHQLQGRLLPAVEKIAETSTTSTRRPWRRAPRRIVSLRSDSA
jgi:uncharacterized membrane protein YccC